MYRSLLFAPGIRPELMTKARAAGADAVIFDLEDSVAAGAKQQARQHVAQQLGAPADVPLLVRIAHPSEGSLERDVACLVGANLHGVVLPKAEEPQDIQTVSDALSRRERELGVPDGSWTILPMIESCLGLHNCYDLSRASRRVSAVAVASAEEGDLMLDLGGRWTPDGSAMRYARGRLLAEVRAAGVRWAIDGVFMNLSSEEHLRADCEMARTMGYDGKLAIHPRQLEAIHLAFTPTAEEVEDARGLLACLEEAQARGEGAARFRGRMVDEANARRARRILALVDGA